MSYTARPYRPTLTAKRGHMLERAIELREEAERREQREYAQRWAMINDLPTTTSVEALAYAATVAHSQRYRRYYVRIADRQRGIYRIEGTPYVQVRSYTCYSTTWVKPYARYDVIQADGHLQRIHTRVAKRLIKEATV
jgi:hypothetical protein